MAVHPIFQTALAAFSRQPETGRVCAVCGKTRSPSGQKDTYGFKTILSRNGIAGDKAHRECVAALRAASES